ncbi:MAG: hypothetical protein JZU55_19215, partial [Afipia sp.]|nr:hypothetical protein [Afipia sp.]
LAAGFDPALSHKMGIDHGISQPIAALTPDLRTPVVPIMISSGGAPLPTLARCYAFGRAVGDAIRSFPEKARALVVGSGGMSQREESSRKRRESGGTGPINETWDRWLLSCMHSEDLGPVLALDNAAVLAAGGVGGQEIRSWIAALGAWGRPAHTADYGPVPTWITGMGCITAFDEEIA